MAPAPLQAGPGPTSQTHRKGIVMHTRRYKTAGFAMAVSAAVALSAAPAAAASPGAYLYALETHGFTIYNPSQAVATGYAICRELNYSTGDVVAARFYQNTPYMDVPTPYDAGIWVLTAVEYLCPWHDHSGERYHRLA